MALLVLYGLAAAPSWMTHHHPEGKATPIKNSISSLVDQSSINASPTKIISPCKACSHHHAACQPSAELTVEQSSFIFLPDQIIRYRPDLHRRFMQACSNKGPPIFS
jgi:hypothetical protein